MRRQPKREPEELRQTIMGCESLLEALRAQDEPRKLAVLIKHIEADVALAKAQLAQT